MLGEKVSADLTVLTGKIDVQQQLYYELVSVVSLKCLEFFNYCDLSMIIIGIEYKISF